MTEQQSLGCDDVQALLDEAMERELSDSERRRLREHAGGCADCAVLLALRHQLTTSETAELEASAPDPLVRGMWTAVDQRITDRRRRWRPHGRSLARWCAATAAAAVIVALTLMTGQLAHDLRRARMRQSELEARLQLAERQIESLYADRPSDGSATRVRNVGEPRHFPLRTARRLLAGRDEVRVAELLEVMEGLPSDAELLSSAATRRALGEAGRWESLMVRGLLEDIDLEDGLQTGEIRSLLGVLELEPDARIPIARLLEMPRRRHTRS